jgi:hypothetical protein
MALRNPQDLYNAGAVVFNTQPYVNFTANLIARKQAKEEAIDSYYQNLNKGINPAGVRTQDVPMFMEKVKGFKEYYNQNKDKIKNPRMDNGKAQTEYQTMYQDALNHVQMSKSEEEKKKPLVELLTDPAKRDRIPDRVLEDLHSHDLPLGDPNRKPFDMSSLSFDPKPFDQTTYLKGFTDIQKSENAPTVSTDPKSLTQTVTKTSTFDDAAKGTIYTRSAGKYASDPSFKELIDKELSKPEYFKELNEVFKKNYGDNIENPEDAAAAYTLSALQPSITKVETQPDTFERQKQMAAITDQYARRRLSLQNDYVKGRIAFRKAEGKKEQGEVLEGLIQRTFDEGADQKAVVAVDGNFVPARKVAVPAEIAKKYTLVFGTGADKEIKQPVKFMMTEDMKYVVPVYGGESTKNRESKIPIEQFRNDLGKLYLTRKDAKLEMDELDFGEEDDTEDGTFTPSAPPAKKPATTTKKNDPLGLF